jgi:hypothetical protein
MLRTPQCIDNRLRDGDKFVSPTHQPHFTPQKHYYFNVSGIHFYKRRSKPQGLVQPERLGKFKNSYHRESNPRPSSLQHSALTTTLPYHATRTLTFVPLSFHMILFNTLF